MKIAAARSCRAIIASAMAAAVAASMMVPGAALAAETGTTVPSGSGSSSADIQVVSNGEVKTVKYKECTTTSSTAKVPASYVVNNVTYLVVEVAKNSFENATITTVTVGKNVEIIRNRAFLNCENLSKVTLNTAKLTKIASRAFAGCTSLKSLTVKSTKLTKIGPKAFKGSAVKTVTLKSTKLTKKGVKGSLKGSKVKTVKVPASKVAKYKKIFKKSNSGKKVTVKAI